MLELSINLESCKSKGWDQLSLFMHEISPKLIDDFVWGFITKLNKNTSCITAWGAQCRKQWKSRNSELLASSSSMRLKQYKMLKKWFLFYWNCGNHIKSFFWVEMILPWLKLKCGDYHTFLLTTTTCLVGTRLHDNPNNYQPPNREFSPKQGCQLKIIQK